jgi:hypothetical protein
LEYVPDNEEEKEIISVLFQYQEAKNNFDLYRLLSFLHEKGEFSFACGLMISKNELQSVLPDFWADIQSKNKITVPYAHECLNGDYFESGELNNPKIKVNKETAEVSVLVTKGFSRVILLFWLIRENNTWLITRTEWGRS